MTRIKKQLVILGAGGHGRSVADIAESANAWSRIVFLDDNPDTLKRKLPFEVSGKPRDLYTLFDPKMTDVALGIGVGMDSLRLSWLHKVRQGGFCLPPVIHPSAIISRHSSIGDGTVVMASVIVNTCTLIGEAVILNTACTIGHDCQVHAGAHISSGVNVGGGTRIDTCAWLGIGAKVIHGRHIGAHALAAAGAVVVRDIAPNDKVAGVPARPMHRVTKIKTGT